MPEPKLQCRCAGTSTSRRAAICLAIAATIWSCAGCNAKRQAPKEVHITSSNGKSPQEAKPPDDLGIPDFGHSGNDVESVKADLDTSTVPCRLEPGHNCKVTVFFATDRKPSGSTLFSQYFSGERNEADPPLMFGTVVVSIPAEHRVGRLEGPLPFFKEDARHHVVVLDLHVTPENVFVRQFIQHNQIF